MTGEGKCENDNEASTGMTGEGKHVNDKKRKYGNGA